MPISTDRIEAEALKLPLQARARLAERLLASLDEDEEVERAWEAEAQRRYAEFQAGRSDAAPADEVLARARGRLAP